MHKVRNYIIVMWIIIGVICAAAISVTIALPIVLKNQETNDNKQAMIDMSNKFSLTIVQSIQTVGNLVGRSNSIVNYFGPYLNNSDYSNIMGIGIGLQQQIGSVRILQNVNNVSLNLFASFCKTGISPSCVPHGIKVVDGLPFAAPLENKTNYIFQAQFTPLTSVDNLVIGLDLTSVPTPLDELWNNSANLTASSRLTISQGIYGIYLIKKNNYGYSTVVLLVGKMIRTIVNESNVDVVIFDMTNPIASDQILYSTSNNFKFASEIQINDNVINNNIEIFNRNWTVFYIYKTSLVPSNNVSIIVISVVVPTSSAILILIVYLLAKNIISNYSSRRLAEIDKQFSNTMIEYVNHEVRNPLNGIIGLTDLVILELEDYKWKLQEIINIDPITSNLNTVMQLCVLIKHIVDDILDIRKIESGKLEISPQEVNPHKLVKDVMAIVQHKIQEKHPRVNFIKDVQVPIDYTIFVDKHRVIQIILNFLTNSIKFTDEGYICIRVVNIDDVTRISVEDTGRGIPEAKRKLIFKPFSQTQYEDSTRHGGVGLGLYLCSLLANTMNIKIDFKSELDKGTTFWIDIKKKKSE